MPGLPAMIVLNDDSVICEDCYDDNASETALEIDPGAVPFARIPGGRCKICDRTDVVMDCPFEPHVVVVRTEQRDEVAHLRRYLPQDELADRRDKDRDLERAVEEIIRVAKRGDWAGGEVPDPVAAAIAHAGLVLRQKRQQ